MKRCWWKCWHLSKLGSMHCSRSHKEWEKRSSHCPGLRNTPCPHGLGTSLFHTVRAGDEHGALAQKEEGNIVFYFWVKAGLISITKCRVSQTSARRTSYECVAHYNNKQYREKTGTTEIITGNLMDTFYNLPHFGKTDLLMWESWKSCS